MSKQQDERQLMSATKQKLYIIKQMLHFIHDTIKKVVAVVSYLQMFDFNR